MLLGSRGVQKVRCTNPVSVTSGLFMPCSISVCAVENSSSRALVEIVSKDKCTEHGARAQNPVVGHGRAWNQPGHGRLKRKSMDKSQSQFSIEIHDTQCGVRQPPATLPCFAGEEFGQCKWHTSSVRTKFSFDRKKGEIFGKFSSFLFILARFLFTLL